MTLDEANRRLKLIEKTINKIMSSDIAAETKLAMINAQYAKMGEVLEASK